MWGYAFYLGTDRNVANRLRVSVQREFSEMLYTESGNAYVDFMTEMEAANLHTKELEIGYWLMIPNDCVGEIYDDSMGEITDDLITLHYIADIQKFIEEQKLRPTRWDEVL